MTGRFGRAGGWILGAALLVGACGAVSPSVPDSSSAPGTTSAATSAVASSAPGLALPLKGTALPVDVEPGGLDAARFAFTDKQGVGILNLDTDSVIRLPAPPRGAAFRPTSLGGNVLAGDVLGAIKSDPQATIAMAYSIADESWIDVAGRLPDGHASTAIATDGTTIAGVDLGAPGSKGAASAFAYDVASDTITGLPPLSTGGVPRPRAVGGGRIAGGDNTAAGTNGWVYDLTSGAYTMLEPVAGSPQTVPNAITNDTVVGSLGGKAGGGTPFVYDAAAKAFSTLPVTGATAKDVSASGVLLVPDSGWNGWLRNLTSGAQVAFDKVIVDGAPLAIRPWALSDGWVIGLTAPPQGSSAAFGEAVAINVGEGP